MGKGSTPNLKVGPLGGPFEPTFISKSCLLNFHHTPPCNWVVGTLRWYECMKKYGNCIQPIITQWLHRLPLNMVDLVGTNMLKTLQIRLFKDKTFNVMKTGLLQNQYLLGT